jgi:putative Holliday junction resolvase
VNTNAPNITTIEEFYANLHPNKRLMGLDLGSKTIGIAISDLNRQIATPFHTIRRKKFGIDAAELIKLIENEQPQALVLGLPLNMDGSEGPRVQSTHTFVRNLNNLPHFPKDIPFIYWDERLTTVAAERSMLEGDLSRAKRGEIIDQVAASLILQGALDRLASLGR